MLGYFLNETVQATLYRASAGLNVKGVWTPGSYTPESISIIAPQPVKADELTMLDDGEHVSDYLKTWTADTTVATREGTTDADEIEWKGSRYKVMQVDDRATLGNYVRVIMRKVG